MTYYILIQICGITINRQHRMNKSRQPFRSKGAQVDTEMKLVGIYDVRVMFKENVHLSLGIFGFYQPVRNIDIPVREFVVKSCDPFRNTSFTGINFLASSN